MVGNTFYVAGTIGLLPDQTVPETAQEEARIVLTNVQNTLEAAGLTMDDLVSVQVYSSDVADYDAFNEVYRTFFTRNIRRGHIWARAGCSSGRGSRCWLRGQAIGSRRSQLPPRLTQVGGTRFRPPSAGCAGVNAPPGGLAGVPFPGLNSLWTK